MARRADSAATRAPETIASDACDGALAGVSAVILAGGLGTRLRSVVADRPKVLAEVDGVPFVFHLLEQLAAAGVKHVVLATGHRGDQVAGVVGSSYATLTIEHSREPAPAGTGGALRHALPLLRSAVVLVLNGDSYCELDLAHLWLWHHQRPAHGTLALTRVDDARRFGTVVTADYGRVVRFVEKSPAATPGVVNAGLYVLRRSLLAEIPAGVACSLEHELLPHWLATGIYGYARTGRFIDIGTPESLARATGFFAEPAPCARPAAHSRGRAHCAPRAHGLEVA